jgi:hypothetical protein
MAAWDGFQIVLNNGTRYIVVAGAGKLMMLIGQFFIAVTTTVAFYCIITFDTSAKSNIIEPLYLLAVLSPLCRSTSSFLILLEPST